MKHHDRSKLGIALIAVLALLASACGSDAATPVESESGSETTEPAETETDGSADPEENGLTGEITITVYPDWEFIELAATDFMEANPGATVNLEAIAGASSDYFASLPRIIGTDEAPDITVVSAGRDGWQELIGTGNLADVSEVWSDLGLENLLLDPVIESYTQPDGSHYAVNVGLNWIPVIYYNKTMFEELGIEAPDGGRIASDEDWLNITSKLADNDKIPFALNTVFGGRYLWMQHATSNCGTEWMQDLMRANEETTAKYVDPCSMEAIEKLAGWQDLGIYGNSPATVDRDIAEALMFSEQAGMYLSGSWETGPITSAELEFDVSWFLLPSMAAEPTIFGLETYDALAIAENSENKELAKAFLTYVADSPFQEAMVEYARFSSRTDISYDPATIPELALTQYEQLAELSGPAAPNVKISARIKSRLNEGWVEILAGTISPADLMQEIQDIYDEELAG